MEEKDAAELLRTLEAGGPVGARELTEAGLVFLVERGPGSPMTAELTAAGHEALGRRTTG